MRLPFVRHPKRAHAAIASAITVALLCLAGTSSASAVSTGATPVRVHYDTACQDVTFIGAMGSGQNWADNKGLGPEVELALTAFASHLAGYKVGYFPNPYPAALFDLESMSTKSYRQTFFASIDSGVKETLNFINARVKKCGDTEHFVLAGYSQGAMVNHRALFEMAKKSGLLPLIDGVIAIADGDRVDNQGGTHYGTAATTGSSGIVWGRLWGAAGTLYKPTNKPVPNVSQWEASSRYHDVCDRGDIVCAYPAEPTAGKTIHTTHYRPGGEAAYLVASAATNVSKITRLRAPAGLSVTGTDLGTLPGGTNSSATDVSGNLIVGYSEVAGGEGHAFVYDLAASTPHMVDLGTLPGGTGSGALGIDGNLIVGSAYMPRSQDPMMGNGSRAFVYDLAASAPQMVDLGTLPGGTESGAADVDGNLIAGESNTADGTTHGFVYDMSASTPHMVDLGTLPGGNYSRTWGVDGNLIVGEANTADGEIHGFVYDVSASTPQMVDLGTLPGGNNSGALGVEGNLIVGKSEVVGGTHAFVYDMSASTPQMVDLGTLPGGSYSQAWDVSGNLIVGDAVLGDAGSGDWTTHAFVYDLSASLMVDLGTLDRGTGWAYGIDGNLVVGETGSSASDILGFPMHATLWELKNG